MRTGPLFDPSFRDGLDALFQWRRDVRHFRKDPIDEETVARLLACADLAPSVGNSQPWRFVRVDDGARRGVIIDDFTRCNAAARALQPEERQDAYARLKLEGLREAPLQLAVFCDEATDQGHGLGQATMPETRRYSVVMAIHTLWLAARARGLGVGWVSVLDPQTVTAALDVPAEWAFVAYLCIGWPREEHPIPELERLGWQSRRPHPVVRR
ncbi:cob(II)yrinic acid a,c-diamide reductase [Rhodospirillum rubrum F11]|uniref:5,6-dimethylbenzimidazole synthase n=2 Tax=Rhodospirillum rubrum TaxID=1085 RepID=BLUB_RHORT|nr:5,6-dimethylbenzimidazole synthase [Rhodospirillum rubrum]Q2RNG5.1 RecName: Full=5,6-dimethylbenzimidazole synthase; Short=DMB synthase [Rhodospirillum rubrum ATCC 11170]ABC24330.1 cob(II)yrinic acid a,c-diamide reductase [Rhodospirillum rubrum ATCC 11170]AEO50081.1 cob(II)yrinic acid a,c-diamide reductase [Rhodospirillum rubrum F11]MBK5956048.1 5,6-dimethylbenzimidazole synthase [Rhodospirillum rubrum]QXG80257.1 5,6-dimethylbenzimidazole synthase [Rhodospirillum rubrum]HCF17311.1 5,6-dime